MSTPGDPEHPAPSPGAGTHWDRVEQLFHEARERPLDQRAGFLAQACGGDAALQREVESLLAQEDGLLLRDGVQTIARRMTGRSHEGTRLGPYVLGPLIGEGGMGEVYRARDVRLDREVAIKVLPPSLRTIRTDCGAPSAKPGSWPHSAIRTSPRSLAWKRATASPGSSSSSSRASRCSSIWPHEGGCHSTRH